MSEKKLKKIVMITLMMLFANSIASGSTPGYIHLDKEQYLLGELVTIRIQLADLSDAGASIIFTHNIYQFMGIPKESLLFRPKEAGTYLIELVNLSDTTLLDKQNFTVLPLRNEQLNQTIGTTPRINGGKKLTSISIRNSRGARSFAKIAVFKQKKKLREALANQTIDLAEFINDTIDVEIVPETKLIDKIDLQELHFNGTIKIGIDEVKTYPHFIKAYAIDPSTLSFVKAIVTATAQGSELFKCRIWDFPKQVCRGSWIKIKDIIPGKKYSFSMTSKDPGYGEQGGSPPAPHPVQGFVFTSETVQGDSGTPVRITDINNSHTVLTYTTGPPIPGLGGFYGADIFGDDNDSITVRAWNSTHYGESSAVLQATTTYANVTMNLTRPSETNVSITFPSNHSLFEAGGKYNVSANISVLGNNGVNCNATLFFSSPDIFVLQQGESYTHDLGNINLGESTITQWNVTANKEGSTNITVYANCSSDGINFENENSDTVSNSTVQDTQGPSIILLSPENNTYATIPVLFTYNVTDPSGIANCSLLVDGVTNKTNHAINQNFTQNFTLTLDAGEYNWQINCTDNSTNLNQNGSLIRIVLISVWHTYFGNVSSLISLRADDNSSEFKWYVNGQTNIYAVETGTSINWYELQALGRNSSNMSAFDDFHEADLALRIENFSDSINNTFTLHNAPISTGSFKVYEKNINDVPSINSTNTSHFITGILWDTGDGNTEYNQSQDLIFITKTNTSKPGKYGIYDYEIKIPFSLSDYKLGSGTVTFYVEIL